jgi:hypothetical protein
MDYFTKCTTRNVKPKIHKNVILPSFVREENTFRVFGNRVPRRMSCVFCTPYKILLSLSKMGDKVKGECSIPNEHEKCIPSFCQMTGRNDATSDICMYIRR